MKKSIVVKFGRSALKKYIQKPFNRCFCEDRVQKYYPEAEIILFFQKWHKTEIENYRPFSSLLHFYKLFTKVTNR